VDDEPDVAAVLVEVLGRDGHKADTATNGAMALEMLARRPYDLVLCDTKMPVSRSQTSSALPRQALLVSTRGLSRRAWAAA